MSVLSSERPPLDVESEGRRVLAIAPESWNGHRYFPISSYYRERFGERVYRISVSVAGGCPKQGEEGKCIFCDEWGSAAYHVEAEKDLAQQISINGAKVRERYRSGKSLVYFQAYTNTLDEVEVLERRFETALAAEGVCGIALGTRPDSLSSEQFNLFRRYRERTYLEVELGVQSFVDEHLAFLNRGHSAECSREAILRLKEESGVEVAVHLIFGIPGETFETLKQTASELNKLPVTSVKLHQLHVLERTPLADLYRKGNFSPLELEEYAERVCVFLQHLRPTIAVHRLSAVSARWHELIAPAWTKEKMRPAQVIEHLMLKRGALQGDRACC